MQVVQAVQRCPPGNSADALLNTWITDNPLLVADSVTDHFPRLACI